MTAPCPAGLNLLVHHAPEALQVHLLSYRHMGRSWDKTVEDASSDAHLELLAELRVPRFLFGSAFLHFKHLSTDRLHGLRDSKLYFFLQTEVYSSKH